MYSSYSLRAAARVSSSGTVPTSALGPLGVTRGGAAAAVAAPASVRSLSATSAAGSHMEQPKQEQQDAVHGDTNTGDKGHWDPITQSFGEAYSTRADEEGFGTVYVRGDDKDRPGHPEYNTSQGCEVSEKEKGRHLKDDKHATT
ncbi:hypothetical protein PR202_ga13274 [Eleusine coracana subsp. coracana]|uniref:Uncharacterized protein n=1 Tax=Eleusine coracana subsp. coracana TaxID=191504 RepID=A0AAV5CDU6_ELECO|nr:hypothetical protein QOZ80_3AG0218330 [Eleusine coracana subsp. coracana]GJM96438.1 hypothetical protein PR202_ga13274 [Eleusine coracana subsp. coracana]